MNNRLYDDVIEILSDNISAIEKDNILFDADLRKVGLDSISFIKVIVAIEEKFNCEIPYSKLLLTEMNTVNKIIDTITTIKTDNKSR